MKKKRSFIRTFIHLEILVIILLGAFLTHGFFTEDIKVSQSDKFSLEILDIKTFVSDNIVLGESPTSLNITIVGGN